MFVAVAVWAGYSLLLRRRPADLPQMVTLVFSIAIALPMLLPFMLVAASGNQLHLSFPVLIGTFYIAIFGSVIGFLFWSYGVTDIGPAPRRAVRASNAGVWCSAGLRLPRRTAVVTTGSRHRLRAIRHRLDRNNARGLDHRDPARLGSMKAVAEFTRSWQAREASAIRSESKHCRSNNFRDPPFPQSAFCGKRPIY